MESIIDNILFYFSPIIVAIFVTATIIGKAILKQYGFKVALFSFSISDYKNLKKLINEKPELCIIYYILFFSTVCVFLSIGLFIISMLIY